MTTTPAGPAAAVVSCVVASPPRAGRHPRTLGLCHRTPRRSPQGGQDAAVECHQRRHRDDVDEQEREDDAETDHVRSVTEQLLVLAHL